MLLANYKQRWMRLAYPPYSAGPHLHFVVHRNGGMKTVSVPFEFVSKRGIAFTPEAGKYIGGK